MAATPRCRRHHPAPRRRAECGTSNENGRGSAPAILLDDEDREPRRFGRDRALQSELLLALAERAQPQRVELDEARGVAVVVGDGAFLESDQILIVQRIFALAADHDDVALV